MGVSGTSTGKSCSSNMGVVVEYISEVIFKEKSAGYGEWLVEKTEESVTNFWIEDINGIS